MDNDTFETCDIPIDFEELMRDNQPEDFGVDGSILQ